MQHQLEEIIVEQYQIIDCLGSGLSGETYKAVDLRNKHLVVLKVLSLQQASNWKVLELFEREASILSQLQHPSIPNYLNYFQIDNTQEKRWYLIQQFIPGQSLSDLIDNGWRTTEAEIINLTTQILEILIYLHNFQPPVIHRDIKPQNIIRQSDGKIYLVDFGAVTDIYRQTFIGNSTVVGTYGYMPPEQFRGQAVPSTDLYGLGATLLYLLTSSPPAEFPQKKLKIDFRSSINVSDLLGDWLEIILEPAIEDRFDSASQALAVLTGEKKINIWQNSTLRQPPHSEISMSKTRNKISFIIPHNKGEPGDLNNRLIIFYISLFLAILFFSSPANSNEFSFAMEMTIRIVLAIPLSSAILYFLFNYLFANFGYTQLEIDRTNFYLKYNLFGFRRKVFGNTKDITEVKTSYNLMANTETEIPSVIAKCLIIEGIKHNKFGRYIKRVEKEWLIKEINKFLDQLIDHQPDL